MSVSFAERFDNNHKSALFSSVLTGSYFLRLKKPHWKIKRTKPWLVNYFKNNMEGFHTVWWGVKFEFHWATMNSTSSSSSDDCTARGHKLFPFSPVLLSCVILWISSEESRTFCGTNLAMYSILSRHRRLCLRQTWD